MKLFSKTRIFGALLCGALAIPFTSCTDLEPEVFSDLTEANFPVNEGEVISSYLSSYSRLYPMMNHNSYMSIQEVSSDEMMIPHRGADWFDGGLWLRAHRHEYTANDGAYNNAWIFLYQGALQCNSVINLLNTTSLVGDADKARFIGELRSLRAYWYFLLTDAFGDVPLVTEQSDPSVTAPPNTSRAEIIDYLISELEDSAGALSRNSDEATYGKMNYWANRALLSRIALNSEKMTGTNRNALAISAADEVINSGIYSLTDDYFENFDADNGNAFNSTSENIWVIPYDAPGTADGFNLGQMTLHYSSQATFNLQEQPWNGYCTLQEFYESYDDDDLRKGVSGDQQTRGNFLAGPQFAADGVTPLVDGNADDPGGPELVYTPEVNALEPNAFRQAGARVFKYGYGNEAPNSLPNDFPILRYSEVLLNKAEAMWRSNEGGYAMMVNMVRDRAGLDDIAEGDIDADELLAERGREFFYEGLRRTDLIRFGKYNDAWFGRSAGDANDEVFPIPQPQLNANPNLVQNEGY